MLDSKELMRGNWIEMINGKPDQVVDVMCDSVNTVNGGGILDDIDPIPLTPSLLDKCGAKLEGIHSIINVGGVKLRFRFNAGKCYSEMGDIYLVDRITYLHQLQNLYFLFTGNELNPSLLTK